jgi:chromosome segregation ATPase
MEDTWLKRNWVHVLMVVLSSGVTTGTIQTLNAWRDARISALETQCQHHLIAQTELDREVSRLGWQSKANSDSVTALQADSKRQSEMLAKAAWQLEDTGKSITALQSDARRQQESIASISARLDVMGAKIDQIYQILKQDKPH